MSSVKAVSGMDGDTNSEDCHQNGIRQTSIVLYVVFIILKWFGSKFGMY